MIRTWVIGCGGLLGGSITRDLAKNKLWCFIPSTPFLWNDPTALNRQFITQIAQFFAQFNSGDQWQIIWVAGKSTMRSSDSTCLQETASLKDFLHNLGQTLKTQPYEGRMGFASTAGGIYTQTQDGVITESSATSPSTPYAEQKLLQEGLLKQWASDCSECQKIIIGRFSTLYGLHQDQSKKQGLISTITSCITQNQELSLFVPLETKRDYLWSDDAAQIFLWHLDHETPKTNESIRIIAQEESISIAEMLKQFQSITGKQVKVSHSAELPKGIYPLEIHFKSKYPNTNPDFQKLSLREGIEKVLANLSRSHIQ